MSSFERGVVRKVTFEIEYPDGSRKTETLDNPSDVAVITLAENRIPDQDSSLFNVSDADWKQNPAMLVYYGREADVGVPNPVIPFCTHNGCKS